MGLEGGVGLGWRVSLRTWAAVEGTELGRGQG